MADSDHVLYMEPDLNPHPPISGIHMGTEPTTSTFSNKEDGGEGVEERGGGGGEEGGGTTCRLTSILMKRSLVRLLQTNLQFYLLWTETQDSFLC